MKFGPLYLPFEENPPFGFLPFHMDPLDGSQGTRLALLLCSAFTLSGCAPAWSAAVPPHSVDSPLVGAVVELGIPGNPSYSFVNGG